MALFRIKVPVVFGAFKNPKSWRIVAASLADFAPIAPLQKSAA
jgi:hypothetical protein